MKQLFLVICLLLLSFSICNACSIDCTECDECSVLFEWSTEGIPSPVILTSLLHQLLPVFEDIDCMTITNAAGECAVLKDPMDFTTFDYTEFASSVCEITTLRFFDCDGGTNEVPIPGALILLGSGLFGLGIIKRKHSTLG